VNVVERAGELAALLSHHVVTPRQVSPDQRSEANRLIADIDEQMRDLHRVRAELVSAVRAFDDSLNQVVDEWLRERGRRTDERRQSPWAG
jgi:hypothetical protein